MITSRPLVQAQKLRLLIDTESFNRLLSSDNKKARSLLSYSNAELLEFTRTPDETDFKELKGITAYIEKYDDEGNIVAIEIPREKTRSVMAFSYRMGTVEDIARRIYQKEAITAEETNRIVLIFVQALFVRLSQDRIALRETYDANVLVTNTRIILENRLWFESHFPGFALNVLSVEEATEVVDLFLKQHHRYHLLSNHICNKGLLYWLSFRSKVHRYHVGDPILDALARRLIFILMSIDEIGFQYFMGANNDTMDDTLYHFNYFVSLTSGIFDNLAIRTNDQYDLGFGDRPERISLNPRAGRKFLKAIREKNTELREHIIKHVILVKLIYEMREVVIHRELLQTMSVVSIGATRKEEWKINFIQVNEDIVQFVHQCQDEPVKYDFVTKWGLYELSERFLEPFRFVKSATGMLISFVDEYLKLLGFTDFIQDLESREPDDDFLRKIKLFESGKLAVCRRGIRCSASGLFCRLDVDLSIVFGQIQARAGHFCEKITHSDKLLVQQRAKMKHFHGTIFLSDSLLGF